MSLSGQKSLLPRIMHAQFSNDMKYRYTLTRDWSRGGTRKIVNFIMTNPGTAGETNDDTITRRCMSFADSWGYNGIIVTNLFTWRGNAPGWLRTVFNPVGLDDDSYLLSFALSCDLVVCAWGNYGGYRDRDQEVIKLLQNKVTLNCLSMTNFGRPRHLLRCSKDKIPLIWVPGVDS